jgi:hypothetical protein
MRFAKTPLVLTGLALLVALPASALAGKPGPSDFKIRISAEGSCGDDVHVGSFHAQGALSGSGTASVVGLQGAYYGYYYVVLEAADGSLVATILWDDTAGWTFDLANGTGVYAGITGSGTPTTQLTWLYPKGTTGKEKRYGDGCGAGPCWCPSPANGVHVDIELAGTLGAP